MKGIRIARLLLAAGMCAVLLAACGTSEEIVLFDDVTSKAADGSSHEAEIEKNEQQEDSVFEIEPELPAEEQEQSMLTREDVWGKYDLETLLDDWEKKIQDTVGESEFTPKLCDALEQEAQSTEPADVSVEENVAVFSVKTTREEADAHWDVTLAGGEYVTWLLYEMYENGVLYPCVQIVCTDQNGGSNSQMWRLPDDFA